MNQDQDPKDWSDHFPKLGKVVAGVGIALMAAVLLAWRFL